MKTKLKLEVTVDQNDADYATKISDVTPAKLKALEPVFKAIQGFKPYDVVQDGHRWTHKNNWPLDAGLDLYPRRDLGEKDIAEIYAGILTEEQREDFNDYVPWGEAGFHSVVSIVVLHVSREETRFKK